ncbi:jg17269 [Pararge aegeria aegeria]|uniref:Jg17269 protein n=1 Tax=Pararge aegeria aegeria TaxID=348720 RepID=A0A8S4R593_9NEOP|nr:jg17269 [Pararge aegeria aegeria]
MNDSNAYPQEDGVAAGGARLAAQYKFSQDELRVLKECNTESFYQRSLPLGTTFGLAAFFGVQGGHLKPNPRFGAFPKVTLAVIVGYFLGKLSYQQACAEKLMALPGSYIGQLLRDKKEGRFGYV